MIDHLLQIRVLQIRVLQIRVLQIRVLQIRVLQIRVLQIRVLQIQSVFYKSNPVHVLQYADRNCCRRPFLVAFKIPDIYFPRLLTFHSWSSYSTKTPFALQFQRHCRFNNECFFQWDVKRPSGCYA